VNLVGRKIRNSGSWKSEYDDKWILDSKESDFKGQFPAAFPKRLLEIMTETLTIGYFTSTRDCSEVKRQN
jgi:hypothetical protein